MNIVSTHRLIDYKEFLSYGDTLVETGSGHGDGIRIALEAGFQHVISIEAQPENYQICVNKFLSDIRVKLVLGESEKVLSRLSWDIAPVFFLDAHVSGEMSFGYEEWKSGNPDFTQNSIIRRELSLILGRWIWSPLIAIDDVNGEADGMAQQYATMIEISRPDCYRFYFYDENRGGEHLYEDKIFVAAPLR